ncbi:hypothetical protein AB0J20_07790 [Micromonospora costi]|uniref:hypothetical protein n=1 Tax=Micromonospora costi TaxID=1530042 RepID=UPI0033CC9FEE
MSAANAYHLLLNRHIRVEHWANALNGGPAAARSMLGQQIECARLPYFFSDQYDLGMEYSGWVAPGGYDRVVFRGDPTVVDGRVPTARARAGAGRARMLGVLGRSPYAAVGGRRPVRAQSRDSSADVLRCMITTIDVAVALSSSTTAP